MSRYVRYQTVISRNADEHIEEDHWLKQFQKNLQKGAVQPKSVDQYLFDQINSIMNGKGAKYPSVAAAVKDMQDRSGLTEYLNKVHASEDDDDNGTVMKNASDDNDTIDKKVPMEEIAPIVVKKCPSIKDTLHNIVKETRGNSSIPAIIDRLRSIHSVDISDGKDWDDDNLVILVSKVNLEEKKNNHSVDNFSNLGVRNDLSSEEEDPSNSDAFFALMPAKS